MDDNIVAQLCTTSFHFSRVPNNSDVDVKPVFYSNYGDPVQLKDPSSQRLLLRSNIPHPLSIPDFHLSPFNVPQTPPPPVQNLTPVSPLIPELVPSTPLTGCTWWQPNTPSSSVSSSTLTSFANASTNDLSPFLPASPVVAFHPSPLLHISPVHNSFSSSLLNSSLRDDPMLIGSHHPSPLPLHHELAPSFNFTSRPTTADGIDIEMPFAADFGHMNNPAPERSSPIPHMSSTNKLLGTTIGEPPMHGDSTPEQLRFEPRFGPVTRSNRKTAAPEREEPKNRSSAQPRPGAMSKAPATPPITKPTGAPIPSPPSSNERASSGGTVDDGDLSDLDLETAAPRKTAPSRVKKRNHPPQPAPKSTKSVKVTKPTPAPTAVSTKTLPPRTAKSTPAKSKVSTAKPPRTAAPARRRRIEALHPQSTSCSESGSSDLSGFTASPPLRAVKTEGSGSGFPSKYPERRMVQNRTAQAKYRSKNKRLWELRWQLGCDVGSYLTLFKEGHMSAGTAMGYLLSFYDSYAEDTKHTCQTTGDNLKDEVEERAESALAAAKRNGHAR